MASESRHLPGMDQGIERRLRYRFDTPGLEASVERRPVQISDLSLTGLGFTASDRLQPKHRYGFVIHGRGGDFEVRGEVVWCHISETVHSGEGETAHRYRGGLRFDRLKTQEADDLVALLDTLSRQKAQEGETQ